MMQLDEKKQRTVKMTLRIVVAVYIGFMGGMLVKGYLGDPNIAFLIFGILFLVLAVGFIVYASPQKLGIKDIASYDNSDDE